MSDILESQFQGIGEILKGAKKVLIASHQNPDPDAVSSVLALHYVFKNMGLLSFPYLPINRREALVFCPVF